MWPTKPMLGGLGEHEQMVERCVHGGLHNVVRTQE